MSLSFYMYWTYAHTQEYSNNYNALMYNMIVYYNVLYNIIIMYYNNIIIMYVNVCMYNCTCMYARKTKSNELPFCKS